MSNIYVDSNGNSIDLDKLKYDLAMIYAKRKFNDIDLSQPTEAPDYMEYMDTLLEYFGSAYQELCNYHEDYIINAIDFTHEYEPYD